MSIKLRKISNEKEYYYIDISSYHNVGTIRKCDNEIYLTLRSFPISLLSELKELFEKENLKYATKNKS